MEQRLCTVIFSFYVRHKYLAGAEITVIFISGREKPDIDDKLLGDTGLDGPSPKMERVRIRRNPSDPRSLQPRLEARHDPLQ